MKKIQYIGLFMLVLVNITIAQNSSNSVLKTITLRGIGEQDNSIKIITDDNDTLFLLKYWHGLSSFVAGKNNSTVHYGSLTLGDNIQNLGVESYAFGRNLKTCACSSFQYAFGKNIETVENQMIFGVGIDKNNKLKANEDNCIAFGYNDSLPTLIIQNKKVKIDNSLEVVNHFSINDYNAIIKIGYNTGYASPQENSIFIGNNAGRYTLADSDNNIFLGNNAGLGISTGTDNVYVGNNTGEGTTNNSYDNTFIGNQAGRFSTSFRNVIIGKEAGKSLSNAENIVIGAYSAQYGGNFLSSSIIGMRACQFSNEIIASTIIGSYAAQYSRGGYNVMIGHRAGQHINGSNNIFIGRQSGFLINSGSNNIYIGYSTTNIDTVSNELRIDANIDNNPLIYGNFETDSLVVNGSLNINTTAGALIVPRMTTAQIQSITPVNGMIVYDTEKNEFLFYENNTWTSK